MFVPNLLIKIKTLLGNWIFVVIVVLRNYLWGFAGPQRGFFSFELQYRFISVKWNHLTHFFPVKYWNINNDKWLCGWNIFWLKLNLSAHGTVFLWVNENVYLGISSRVGKQTQNKKEQLTTLNAWLTFRELMPSLWVFMKAHPECYFTRILE